MEIGDDAARSRCAIPTGALSIDLALGVGGVPRGRIVEIFGPESSGKTTLALPRDRPGPEDGRDLRVHRRRARDGPRLRASAIGVDIDELLVSQPDHGEQALEIADVLIRSGAVDVVAIDSVAALTPQGRARGPDGRPDGRPAGADDVPGHAQAGRQPEPRQHDLHLHQPDPREGRGDVRLARRPSPAAARSSSTPRSGSTSAASRRSRRAPRRSATACASRSSRTRSRRRSARPSSTSSTARASAPRAASSTSASSTASSRSPARSSPTATSGSARAATTPRRSCARTRRWRREIEAQGLRRARDRAGRGAAGGCQPG